MTRHLPFIIFCIVPLAIPAQTTMDTYATTRRIDSLMKHYFKGEEPGAVVAVRSRGKAIFEKSYGLADLGSGRKILDGDDFNIGSLTKQFTALAILQLIRKGKCTLKDTIGQYLKLPPGLASVSIEEMLDHSSGVPDHYTFTDTVGIRHATDQTVMEALQKADSLYFIPGTQYRYSNTAYCLLGLLIEKLSGMSYPAFLEQSVFNPLGMRSARVYQEGLFIPGRVTGYEKDSAGRFRKSDAEESIFFSTESDGGIYLSMPDYMRWTAALLSGKFAQSVSPCWQPRTRVDLSKNLWYGFGWFVGENPGAPRVVYHTGFNGGFRTVVYMIPSENYCISIFANRNDVDLEDLVWQINSWLGKAIAPAKSGPLESFTPRKSIFFPDPFRNCWTIFAPCKKIPSYLISSGRSLNARDMELN